MLFLHIVTTVVVCIHIVVSLMVVRLLDNIFNVLSKANFPWWSPDVMHAYEKFLLAHQQADALNDTLSQGIDTAAFKEARDNLYYENHSTNFLEALHELPLELGPRAPSKVGKNVITAILQQLSKNPMGLYTNAAQLCAQLEGRYGFSKDAGRQGIDHLRKLELIGCRDDCKEITLFQGDAWNPAPEEACSAEEYPLYEAVRHCNLKNNRPLSIQVTRVTKEGKYLYSPDHNWDKWINMIKKGMLIPTVYRGAVALWTSAEAPEDVRYETQQTVALALAVVIDHQENEEGYTKIYEVSHVLQKLTECAEDAEMWIAFATWYGFLKFDAYTDRIFTEHFAAPANPS